MTSFSIDYTQATIATTRAMIVDILTQIATSKAECLPNNALYITLDTTHTGVSLPPFLKAKYPETTTIVLENKFWDLEIEDDVVKVMLSFSGTGYVITFPISAIIGFVDTKQHVHIDIPKVEIEEPEDVLVDTVSTDNVVAFPKRQ